MNSSRSSADRVLRARSRPAWSGWIGLLLWGLACSLAQAQTATSASDLEYRVKAGFVLNFLRFTEWPPEAVPPESPYRIAVAGDAAVQQLFTEALAGRTVHERAVEVIALAPDTPPQGCHLVFVPRAAGLAPGPLVERFGRAPVLLVGETEGFAAAGGTIGFVLRGANIRFQVNLAAAQASGLRLTAKLAGLAEVVRPGRP